MMPLKVLRFLIPAFLAVLALAPGPIRAEPQPGDPCPVESHFVRVAGPENPGSGHFMYCDSGLVWQPVMRFQSAGHVLFNSGGMPAAPLHVWGEAIIGAQGLACDAATEGAIRYDSAGQVVDYCDGDSWVSLMADAVIPAAAPDRGIQFNSAGTIAALDTLVYTNTGDLIVGSYQKDSTGSLTHHSRMFFDKAKSAFRAGYAADPIWMRDGGDAVWNGANVGDYSTAFGYYPEASGQSSFAAGAAPAASGINSIAIGSAPTASGAGSIAIGSNTNASGGSSVVIGSNASAASGEFATALGTGVTASGDNSIALGRNIEAQGDYTFGIQLNDDAKGTHVISQPSTMAVMGGNVGVGTVAPAAPLDVAGEIIVGAGTGLACDSTRTGGLRYSSANTCFEFCDGSNWACIAAQPCGDVTPDGFNFTDLVNQSVSTLVTSEILQITGLGCVVNVQVSGEGAPQYRTCSDSGCSTVVQDWTSGSNTISNNDYIQLRLTTSAAGGDTYSATLAIGNGADVWNATPTGDCTGSPAPGTVCADGTVYAGLSPDGNVKMYATRCDAGQSWDGSTCTGSRFSLSWNNGTSNWTTTGYTSAIAGETNTTGLAGLSDAGSPHYAAQHCDGLSQDGHTDWYLPAKEELDVMYGNAAVIGHFDISGTTYWSSTEIGSNHAWHQRFSDGTRSNDNKDGNRLVRCVRR